MSDMVMIVAHVRRNRRAPVGQALREQGQRGWAEVDVVGHGHAAGGHGVDHVRFEVVIPAASAEGCRQAIARAASVGAEGGGIIITLPVLAMQRVDS